MRPFDAVALRLVFLTFDLATLLLLLVVLRAGHLPSAWALWYWWNPLLVQQTYSAAHHDVLLGPFVLAALLAASSRRAAWAGFALALGTAAKAWPVVLLPLILRPFRDVRRGRAVLLAAFAATSAAAWLPVALSPLDSSSGFVAYGTGWESNDGAFRLLLVMLYRAVAAWPELVDVAPGIVRIAVLLCLGLLVTRQSAPPVAGPSDLARRAGVCLAGLFLLSPTQFPWYYIWLLPLVCVAPRLSLLLPTALLALYPLQWERTGVLWLQHLPVWALLGVELAFPWWRGLLRARRQDGRCGSR